MRTFDNITTELPEQLYKAVKNKACTMNAKDYTNIRALIATVIREQAPQYYTSFDRTISLYKQWERVGEAIYSIKFRRNSSKIMMYKELLPKIKALVDSGLSLEAAVIKAIKSPASRFFLTDQSAVIIFFAYQKKKRYGNKNHKR